MTEILRGKPRFDRRIDLPQVPEGMELYRFYGQPVLIPARLEGEPLAGGSGYTERQLASIRQLAKDRRKENMRIERFNCARMVRLRGI